MPKGKRIAENPELEKFIIELFKEKCIYVDIVKKVKDRFDIKIPASLLSGYKKNYLPPEVVLPKQKRGRPRKDIKKGIVPIGGGEVLIKGNRALNWYTSRIARLDEQADKLLKPKRKLNEEEMKNIINLTNSQNKLYQQAIKLFSEDIRKKEMNNFCADILELVMKVFNRITPQEEKIRRQDFGKRLEEGMDIIFMKWFGEKM